MPDLLADYRKLLNVSGTRSNAGQTLVGDQTLYHIGSPTDKVSGGVSDMPKTSDKTSRDADVGYDDVQSGVLPLDNLLPNTTSESSNKLADEQRADETLQSAFYLAKQNKGGYFLRNGFLFHRIKILRNTEERLVIPKERRAELLQLAHDQLGCHLGARRTNERIGLNFTWPTVVKNVIEHCRCCEMRQRRVQVTYRDMVPIVEACFRSNWFLIIFTSSRCPHAVALRNLTAKSCCEAMLSMWQITGLPTKVTSDRASNFTEELTQEFLRPVRLLPNMVHT